MLDFRISYIYIYILESSLNSPFPPPFYLFVHHDHLPISFHEHETWIIRSRSTFFGICNKAGDLEYYGDRAT